MPVRGRCAQDTKPGKARVIKCLMENMAQPNFGEECKEELQKREDMMKSDYRLDVAVATSCESDVDTYCKVRPAWREEGFGWG